METEFEVSLKFKEVNNQVQLEIVDVVQDISKSSKDLKNQVTNKEDKNKEQQDVKPQQDTEDVKNP